MSNYPPPPLDADAARAAVQDPTTGPDVLRSIAVHHPDLRPYVSAHPAADPGLVSWIAQANAAAQAATPAAAQAQYSPTQAYAPVGQAQYAPGQPPYQGYGPPVPARPSAFGITMRGIVDAVKHIMRSDPDKALETPDLVASATGNRNMTWLLTFAAGSLVTGGLCASFLGGIFGLAGNLSPFGSQYIYDIGAGVVVTALFVGITICFASFLLQAVTVKWTAATRQTHIPFSDAANIVATPQAVVVPVMVLVFLFSLIPGGSGATMVYVVLMIAIPPLGLINQVVIYLGITRRTKAISPKTPLIPYAMLTLAWVVMTSILCFLSMLILGAVMAASFTRW